MSAVKQRSADTWEMVNLVPEDTGLPMTVHAMPRGGARHDVRIKVHRSHGRRMSASNTAEVGVRPVPHLVEEGLRPRDQILVYQWAALNERALVDYWEGRLSTREFLARLQKLPPSAAPP
jgi:hypothetical protein